MCTHSQVRPFFWAHKTQNQVHHSKLSHWEYFIPPLSCMATIAYHCLTVKHTFTAYTHVLKWPIFYAVWGYFFSITFSDTVPVVLSVRVKVGKARCHVGYLAFWFHVDSDSGVSCPCRAGFCCVCLVWWVGDSSLGVWAHVLKLSSSSGARWSDNTPLFHLKQHVLKAHPGICTAISSLGLVNSMSSHNCHLITWPNSRSPENYSLGQWNCTH